MLRCERCNGTNIETKVWADANTDEVLDCVEPNNADDNWCRDCEEHVIFKDDELITYG